MNFINTLLSYKLYFTVIGLIVFALFLGNFGYSNYKEISSFKTWESIDNGIKIESKVEQKEETKKVNNKFSTTIKYIPYIKYSFTYNGKKYESDNISNIKYSFTNESDANSFLKEFSNNFKVYFNPENAKESYLKLNTSQIPTITAFSISALLLIIAILLFIFRDSAFVKGIVFLR